MFEQFTKRMYGVYPEASFTYECVALFAREEDAKAYADNPEHGCGLTVQPTDVAAACWNSLEPPPEVELDGHWMRRLADADDHSTDLGWPILESYADPEPGEIYGREASHEEYDEQPHL